MEDPAVIDILTQIKNSIDTLPERLARLIARDTQGPPETFSSTTGRDPWRKPGIDWEPRRRDSTGITPIGGVADTGFGGGAGGGFGGPSGMQWQMLQALRGLQRTNPSVLREDGPEVEEHPPSIKRPEDSENLAVEEVSPTTEPITPKRQRRRRKRVKREEPPPLPPMATVSSEEEEVDPNILPNVAKVTRLAEWADEKAGETGKRDDFADIANLKPGQKMSGPRPKIQRHVRDPETGAFVPEVDEGGNPVMRLANRARLGEIKPPSARRQKNFPEHVRQQEEEAAERRRKRVESRASLGERESDEPYAGDESLPGKGFSGSGTPLTLEGMRDLLNEIFSKFFGGHQGRGGGLPDIPNVPSAPHLP